MMRLPIIESETLNTVPGLFNGEVVVMDNIECLSLPKEVFRALKRDHVHSAVHIHAYLEPRSRFFTSSFRDLGWTDDEIDSWYKGLELFAPDIVREYPEPKHYAKGALLPK